jgi:DNA-binding CsgD family transcriptional regulator
MSMNEIARKIGCSERAVKQALSRAFKKLRDGRARKMLELSVAREQVKSYGLPRVVKEE